MGEVPSKFGSVTPGDYCWIGANVLINPSVSIGEIRSLGLTPFVTRDVPPFEIWGGVPAKVYPEKKSHESIAHQGPMGSSVRTSPKLLSGPVTVSAHLYCITPSTPGVGWTIAPDVKANSRCLLATFGATWGKGSDERVWCCTHLAA